ncbi:hypothetical protein [Rugamonas sp.]|uniref:hypothetical protein n=1 Tax=Rugamonas sp. TaxID=1926287 RepID=UPI0025D16AC9|nr:hypothetical protein [Rugamonas sp.]
MPDIVVINESTALSDADIGTMLPALARQWNQDLASVWRVEQARFTLLPAGQSPPAGAWWLVFLDNSDQASALAYHDLSNDGNPLSKVFVKTLRAGGASVSVGASHELCEMAVDPWLNGAYQDTAGHFWAAEICDPVQGDQYGYKIGDTLVSDFVTPNWFAHRHSQVAMDFCGHAGAAFDVLPGGYAQKYEPQLGWVQTGGPSAPAAAHGSRRERRRRQAGRSLQQSTVVWNRR